MTVPTRYSDKSDAQSQQQQHAKHDGDDQAVNQQPVMVGHRFEVTDAGRRADRIDFRVIGKHVRQSLADRLVYASRALECSAAKTDRRRGRCRVASPASRSSLAPHSAARLVREVRPAAAIPRARRPDARICSAFGVIPSGLATLRMSAICKRSF